MTPERLLFKPVKALFSSPNIYKATFYLSDNYVIKATAKRWKKKLPKKNQRIEVLLTMGRPNYEERLFIKLCKQAGEPFPIKKIQYKVIKMK